MLAFQFAVDRDKDIKGFLRMGEERAILAAAPANLAHCTDQVAWKRGLHPGIDAFI
jgi:hypothetical protein